MINKIWAGWGKLDWLLLGLLFAVGIAAVTSYYPAADERREAHCEENPSDSEKCHCVKTLVPHVKFTDQFNITADDLSGKGGDVIGYIANGTWQQEFNDTKKVELLGYTQLDNSSGLIKITEIPKDFYLIYTFQVVKEQCVEAVPMGGG